MSHFAKAVNGIVVQIIVAEPEYFDTFVDATPGEWLQTSYNTRGNLHYGPDGKPDGGIALRGNFAKIGSIYDWQNDVFYDPQPYQSWTLNKSTWMWEAPIPKPQDGKIYIWDENSKTWTISEQSEI